VQTAIARRGIGKGNFGPAVTTVPFASCLGVDACRVRHGGAAFFLREAGWDVRFEAAGSADAVNAEQALLTTGHQARLAGLMTVSAPERG